GDNGSWCNYTRDIPNGFYKAYAALSFHGMAPGQMRGSLDRVTDGFGTPDQILAPLGDFNAPGSGGWGTANLVPITFPSGQDAVVKLGGKTTLRFNVNGPDFDYFILAPVRDAPPALSASPPSADSLQKDAVFWVINDLSTAVDQSSIKLILDNHDAT